MFEQIAQFSLRNRAAVVFFTVVLAIAGFQAFQGLPVEAFPDPTDTQVNVITLFPGQPAEEVERQIGLTLERALNGTPGLARLRNLSLFGLSFVTLTFNDGVDALFARSQVLERLRTAELPEGVVPELGPLATPIGEIYRYTLRGSGGDPMKLRTLQDWVVRPQMMRVQGVADVVSYGGIVREVHIEPSPSRLAAYGLTLEDLETALRKASQNASGGVLERGGEQLVIRSTGLVKALADLEFTRVATKQGVPVLVRDVATVTEGWTPRQGVVSRSNEYDSVEGIVLMRRGENPSVVLQRLREGIDKMAAVLPPDVKLSPFYDRTELVDTTLKTVGKNMAEGALLVILVLYVFLLDLRAALVVATVIPLSLLTAFLYLRLRGMSANLLSMGAIDFGIIVDGSVVIVEAIVHHLSATGADDNVPVPERIRRAVAQVVAPTVYALLIIIAAYLPIFLLERVEGRIFAPMSNTVVAALVGALVFSVTLVPVLASLVWRKPIKHKVSPLLVWSSALYRPSLKWAMAHPWLVLAASLGALGISVATVPKLGSEFLPELNEGALYTTFTLPSNISLTEARKLVPRITKLLQAVPVVDEVLSQLGRPEDGTDATLTNNLEFFVKMKAPEQWPADVHDVGDIVKMCSAALAEVPGVEVNFSQPIRDNVNENISGQFGQVAVKLYGSDLTVLQGAAERAKNAIAKVPGVADLGIVKSGEVPQLQIEPDRQALARYGMDLDDFQHIVGMALGGQPVGVFWDGEARHDIVLRLPLAARNDVEKLRKLMVPVAGGTSVPLDSMAKVGLGFGRASINRENGRRYIGIRMNVRGRDLGSFVTEAQRRVNQDAKPPNGILIEWGGEFENKERAMARLTLVLPVALLATLILLFRAFGQFAPALLTLLNVPFALVGGIAALAWMDMPVSVAAAVGFIALIGQASLNGVLVLTAVLDRRKAGMGLDQAILTGCDERLRPVLMTAALAALGLVPAMMSRAIGSETQRPIAAVIVGGTLSACLLTLLVLPAMYRLWVRTSVHVLRMVAPRRPQHDPA